MVFPFGILFAMAHTLLFVCIVFIFVAAFCTTTIIYYMYTHSCTLKLFVTKQVQSCIEITKYVKKAIEPEKMYVTRLVQSDESVLIKKVKIVLFLVIFVPNRLFFISWYSGFLSIVFLRCINTLLWNTQLLPCLLCFMVWYGCPSLLNAFLFVITKALPHLIPKLHTFMYGADMTAAFLGNPGTGNTGPIRIVITYGFAAAGLTAAASVKHRRENHESVDDAHAEIRKLREAGLLADTGKELQETAIALAKEH